MDTLLFIIYFFIFIFLFYYNTFESFTILSNDNIILKKDVNYGRNIYANKDYYINDIIEICPTICDKNTNINSGIIKDYLFKASSDKSALALGYCSLYNHKDDNNASWRVSEDDSLVTIYAIKNIKKGEPIMVNYGDGYWQARNYIKKI